jgi:hypothetical protein
MLAMTVMNWVIVVRLRGHELDFVVHRLPVGPVVQPKPCIVGVSEVCLVPYGGVRTVLPLIGPAPRARRLGTRHERLLAHQS